MRHIRAMSLHLLKLCVGAKTIPDLEAWQAYLWERHQRVFHTTRMVPKRVSELLDGGSIYWVIAGQVSVRQALLDIEPFTDAEGIRRCHLILENKLTPTQFMQQRAFQGWRYLPVDKAPKDLPSRGHGLNSMPEEMHRELSELGLI